MADDDKPDPIASMLAAALVKRRWAKTPPEERTAGAKVAGKARWKGVSKAQRREAALKAARARWDTVSRATEGEEEDK